MSHDPEALDASIRAANTEFFLGAKTKSYATHNLFAAPPLYFAAEGRVRRPVDRVYAADPDTLALRRVHERDGRWFVFDTRRVGGGHATRAVYVDRDTGAPLPTPCADGAGNEWVTDGPGWRLRPRPSAPGTPVVPVADGLMALHPDAQIEALDDATVCNPPAPKRR